MSFFTMKSGVMIRYLLPAEASGLCSLSQRLWELGGRIVLMIVLMITTKSSGLVGDGISHEKRDLPRVIVFTTLIVSEPPFLQKGYDNASNKETLEGFIPDLVEKIAQKLKMPYRLKLVSEGGYGTQREDGTWNGMLGEIISGEADVAAGALSVRPWREKIIDFTVPFMESGIATVVKRPPDGFPLPIESPRELLNQTRIRYGCIPGSLTQAFFRTSPDKDYRKMWHIMSTTLPSVFEWTSRKGIARVRESNGRYVFMLESVFANYLVGQPPCDLVTLDVLLNKSDYAFALQKGSSLTKKINRAMTQLKEAGVMDKFYRKWWKSKCSKRYNRKHNLKDERFKDESKSGNRGKSKKNRKRLQGSNEDSEEESTPPPRQHHRKLETRTISLRGGCQSVNIMQPFYLFLTFLISITLTYLH